MKPIYFIIFFSIFFTLYGLINYYIIVRSVQSFSFSSTIRYYYIGFFFLIAFSFIIGRVLEKFWLSPISKTFIWIGSFWLATMLYFFLIVLLFDVVRLVNHLLNFYPKFVYDNYIRIKMYLGLTSIVIVVVALVIGHLNALSPKVEKIHVKINKKSTGMKSMNIVVASDIHLGTIINRKRFDRIVSMMNNLNPDIILLPGDIVDEDLAPVIKENLGESLRNLKSKYGVYAVTGNHEYIGGVEKAYKYLENNGVNVLRDSSILINETVYLIGREDRSKERFMGQNRKSLSELMNHINSNTAIILMDHQPFQLDEARQAGVDLQLSGHTHHGQIWPLNYITKLIYEISWGYKKKGSTNYYVSSGVGTWGPPIRIGNHPEIVNIELEFN